MAAICQSGQQLYGYMGASARYCSTGKRLSSIHHLFCGTMSIASMARQVTLNSHLQLLHILPCTVACNVNSIYCDHDTVMSIILYTAYVYSVHLLDKKTNVVPKSDVTQILRLIHLGNRSVKEANFMADRMSTPQKKYTLAAQRLADGV